MNSVATREVWSSQLCCAALVALILHLEGLRTEHHTSKEYGHNTINISSLKVWVPASWSSQSTSVQSADSLASVLNFINLIII